MQPRLAGGGAEALQQVSRGAVPIVNGCRHAQQFVEFRMDEVQIDVPAQDRFESRHLWPAAWQVQPLMAHVMLPWTQVKSQQLADTETQMRMAVGICGKPTDRGAALAHDPLDRRTDLPMQ